MARFYLLVLCAAMAAWSALAETRLALIIGNEDYPVEVGELSNPHEDAEKVAGALRAIGFEIVGGVRKDATRDDIWAGVLDFQARLRQAGPQAVGFVYYSGHGGSHEASGVRSNYFIPAKSRIVAANQLPALGVSLKQVIGTLEEAEAKAVFIVSDACRNTLPWTTHMGGAQPDRSFVPQNASTGMLLAYSTGDGETAPDNGVFADELARRLRQPGLTADRLFTLVARDVARRRSGGERPVVSDRLSDDFCIFGDCGAREVVRTERVTVLASDEGTAFAQAVTADTLAAYQAFRDQFPNSRHLSYVTARITELTPRPPTPQQRFTPGSVFRDDLSGGGRGPEMVVVPSGSFMMGSPASETGRDSDEGPQRSVTIGRNFAVGKHEVTVAEFDAFVRDAGYNAGTRCRTYEGGSWDWRDGKSWRSPGFSQTTDDPVTCMDWDAAQAYAEWLSGKTGETYRLLTEAEWEYAARAGTSTPYSFGSNGNAGCGHMNGADAAAKARYSNWTTSPCNDGFVHTSPAGSFSANAFGLYDMHGNVWEWVEDCYTDDLSSQPSNGAAKTTIDCPKRVNRGGSWFDNPRFLRSANRGRGSPQYRNLFLGFRLARDLTD